MRAAFTLSEPCRSWLVRKGLERLVGAQVVFGHGNQSGSHALLTNDMQVSSTLAPRTIAESYDEAIIPLGRSRTCVPCLSERCCLASNIKIRERYVNFDNKVRFGRILEDLDTMAGTERSLTDFEAVSLSSSYCLQAQRSATDPVD